MWSWLLAAFALAFAWSIGAHYTGACMGMPYAAGAIRAERALPLMAVLAFVGAVLASGKVEATVGVGLLSGGTVDLASACAILLVAALLTSAYNFVALPTSTIQILVFSILGVAAADGIAINWHAIELLLAVWALAPFAAFGVGYLAIRGVDRLAAARARGTDLSQVGWLASALVAVGAAASFAMGANDVSNAAGPLVLSGLFNLFDAAVLGGIGIAVGVVTWGRPLLRRVAFDIVRLDRGMAVAAQMAQAAVILVAVAFGQFTSMNQALVGGMLGVGTARGSRVVEWKQVRGILLGWGAGPLSGGGLGFLAGAALVHAGLG
jgi:inorganic phosphate transporter, PiT family